jgi:hypothetical protein
MAYMFYSAKLFDKYIRYWQVKSDCTVTGMFIGSPLDDSNIMTNGAPDIATYFNLIKPFTHKLTNGRYKMVADTSDGKSQYDYTNDNHILIASDNGAKLKYVLDEIEVYNLSGNFFLGKENNENIFKLDSSKNALVTDWDIIGDGSHFLKFTYNGSEQTVNIISGPIVYNQYRIYQTSVTGKNFTYENTPFKIVKRNEYDWDESNKKYSYSDKDIYIDNSDSNGSLKFKELKKYRRSME